ncbi:putative pdcd2_c domain-containing protein [Phaeoacremonium minimum UCRPA7]|uniref:Putative pdcd2_c domain-containing protein n=1 Tax=Phaeoacremonium minimum (strain UCR-PA7) TaxID=1286976 RepID=R8BDE6_PHAM7|nr:putative pdcd2_c domain-containing protein [Phaeoacremonium minimum UCRPA7]EON97317.1 putative pdcd2_c domain-containing protein [Phaeoacremonium minimum UCRPA7]
MASYDSDDSIEENEDFTETDVLLGYASKESKGETTSRLGGKPDWLDAEKAPSAALARCKICKDLMVLILQLNGELPERFPGHERRLSGLGEALFGVKPAAGGSAPVNPFAKSSGANPFAKSPSPGGANPFDSTSSQAKVAESKTETEEAVKDLPKTFAETLSLNNPQQTHGPPPPPEPWPSESDQPQSYPVMYLSDAEYETLDPIPLPPPQATTTMDLDEGGPSSGSGKEDKVVFESTMDSTFQKFADRVGQNPEQCIRYEFSGQPLLYSKADEVGKRLHDAGTNGIPRCGNCGANRVFEVQLTPQAITELEAEEEGLEGMDWGTIIVGVCERDCQERSAGEGEPGYLEEWVGVQWEELTMKR